MTCTEKYTRAGTLQTIIKEQNFLDISLQIITPRDFLSQITFITFEWTGWGVRGGKEGRGRRVWGFFYIVQKSFYFTWLSLCARSGTQQANDPSEVEDLPHFPLFNSLIWKCFLE